MPVPHSLCKWEGFVQMVNASRERNITIRNFTYQLPKPCATKRFSDVNGEQPECSGCSSFRTNLSNLVVFRNFIPENFCSIRFYNRNIRRMESTLCRTRPSQYSIQGEIALTFHLKLNLLSSTVPECYFMKSPTENRLCDVGLVLEIIIIKYAVQGASYFAVWRLNHNSGPFQQIVQFRIHQDRWRIKRQASP